ncbi:hypothetical protein IEU95_04780 [Hoyosella rhizosphaerae]|uniref:Uncharacterized protein n=1 Tax=Hoyosella rhizosphaerae TaxID=1755582 RepID=A0A916UA30_9ACTN|nr:hypothetical protein [Hoyosella rhizosphaerae]MBN4926132.1 hypothetical protein [Hoyosella rhizosphaerae]GGC65339.1 hypothetical protein GCM10011410_17260 [Hoyosella rhizosphaerae]
MANGHGLQQGAPGSQWGTGEPGQWDPNNSGWSHPPRSGRPKPRWIVVAVAAIAIIALVAATLVFLFLRPGQSGASTPQLAASSLLSAIKSGDSTKLSNVLAPEEVGGFSEALSAQDRRARESGVIDTSLVERTLTDGIDIQFTNVDVAVEQIRDDLAKVVITSGDLTISVDSDRLSPEISALIPQSDLAQLGSKTETYAVEDADVEPFIMTVKVGGAWYVSPLYTLFEYATIDEGKPRVDSPQMNRQQFDSAEAAARGALEGLVTSVNTGSVRPLAEALGEYDAKALLTYEPLLADQHGESNSENLSVERAIFTSQRLRGSTYAVPTDLSIRYRDRWNDNSTTISEGCLETREFGRLDYRVCADELGESEDAIFLRAFLESGFLARPGGGWHVTVLPTMYALYHQVIEVAPQADFDRWFKESMPAHSPSAGPASGGFPFGEPGNR